MMTYEEIIKFIKLQNAMVESELKQLKKAIAMNDSERKQLALETIAEAKRNIKLANKELESNYEKISVFDGYDFQNNQIYTEDVIVTKEQAAEYRNVEYSIVKAFKSNNEQKIAAAVATILNYKPQIRAIAKKLENYTNEEALAKAKESHKNLMKAFASINETGAVKKKKSSVFAKVKNFANKQIVAIPVKRKTMSDKFATFTTETVENIIDEFNIDKRITAFNAQRKTINDRFLAKLIETEDNFKLFQLNNEQKFNDAINHIKERVEQRVEQIELKMIQEIKIAKLYCTKPLLAIMTATCLTSCLARGNTMMSNSIASPETAYASSANIEREKTKNKKANESKEKIDISKYENLVGKVSYNDLLSNIAEYDTKDNNTGLKPEQVTAVGYILNAGYLSNETKEALEKNGVISDDPDKMFEEILSARDNIYNAMSRYSIDKAVGKKTTADKYFNNIASLAVNETSKKQIDVIAKSLETIYTGTEEEARKELYKFVEFVKNDEPRIDENDYGFTYSDLRTDGKFAVFMYAPGFLAKLSQYGYDTDVVDNIYFKLSDITSFLKEIGLDCGNMALDKDGLGLHIGKVYGIELGENGNVIAGRSLISGGTTASEETGGYSEVTISSGSRTSTTVEHGGNETVTNVTNGSNTSVTVTEGSGEQVTNITTGENENTAVEEGKQEEVIVETTTGENENTVVEEGKQEEVIVETTGNNIDKVVTYGDGEEFVEKMVFEAEMANILTSDEYAQDAEQAYVLQ